MTIASRAADAGTNVAATVLISMNVFASFLSIIGMIFLIGPTTGIPILLLYQWPVWLMIPMSGFAVAIGAIQLGRSRRIFGLMVMAIPLVVAPTWLFIVKNVFGSGRW